MSKPQAKSKTLSRKGLTCWLSRIIAKDSHETAAVSQIPRVVSRVHMASIALHEVEVAGSRDMRPLKS